MANLNPNRLNLTYLPADLSLMKANANATISKIPADATLTDEERKKSAMDIDVENKIFVEDVLNELSSNGTAIMPAWFNMGNIQTDFTFFEQSDSVLTMYKNVVMRLNDSMRIAGREAYAAALVAYEQYKSAAEAGIPGAQESYDKLKARFEKMAANKPVQFP